MKPESIAARYADRLVKHNHFLRSFITNKTGNKEEYNYYYHLAYTAIWQIIQEQKDLKIPQILKQANTLFGRWLKEDYEGSLLRCKGKTNTDLLMHAINVADERVARLDGLKAYTPDTKTELESDLYYCLDTIIKNWGVHLGLWAILSLASDEPQKAQIMYAYMGIEPTSAQRKSARRIIHKLKELLGDQQIQRSL